VDHALEQGLDPLGGGDAGRGALAAEAVVASAVVPGVGHEPLERQDVMGRRGERDGVAKEHDAYRQALDRLLRDLKVKAS
jgi:hypothetical protein